MLIRLISLEETLPVRSLALREGQPYNKCTVSEDALAETFHIGAIEGEKALGTASFFPKDRQEYEGKGFQLRMMGVLPNCQGQGIGKDILLAGIKMLRQEQQAAYLWCHARKAAYLFYEKIGFTYISEEFEIPVIGTHKTMILWIKNEK